MTITNPEALRVAAPDLSAGIPAHLWTGSDATTREWLLREYGRQLAASARERDDTNAKRQESLRRILAGPAASPDTPAAQLRRLQQILFEAAAVAGTLANAMHAADGPHADAPASPTQEHPQ